MEELQITVEQLKNYLGTDLKITFDSDGLPHDFVGLDMSNEGVHLISPFGDFGRTSLPNIRPICYRLSDLDKEIEHNGERFVPIERILKERDCDAEYEFIEAIEDDWASIDEKVVFAPFSIMQKLFEWHFWPFGDEYFEKGLVIDKMIKEATNE